MGTEKGEPETRKATSSLGDLLAEGGSTSDIYLYEVKRGKGFMNNGRVLTTKAALFRLIISSYGYSLRCCQVQD